MAIFNMVQGKVPMTYRGTKTKLLAHFDNAANFAETAVYMNSGGAANAYLQSPTFDLPGKFGSGCTALLGIFDNLVPIGTSPFTIEFWVRPYSNGPTYAGFGEPSTSSEEQIVHVDMSSITLLRKRAHLQARADERARDAEEGQRAQTGEPDGLQPLVNIPPPGAAGDGV